MEIQNFSVDKQNNTLNWSVDGESVSVSCDNLDSAHFFSGANLAIALVGSDGYPTTLIGFNEKGKQKFKVNAPEGFKFSYLTEHPTAGVAVVCVTDEYQPDGTDWHFSINPSTGELKKHCRAY